MLATENTMVEILIENFSELLELSTKEPENENWTMADRINKLQEIEETAAEMKMYWMHHRKNLPNNLSILIKN